MRAIKINVENQTLEYVEVEGINTYYEQIGNECSTFACPVTFDNNDGLFVDDEGLFHKNIGAFYMKDWSSPIVGNALIIGCDDEGESVDCKTTIEDLKGKIKFIPHYENSLTHYFSQFQ